MINFKFLAIPEPSLCIVNKLLNYDGFPVFQDSFMDFSLNVRSASSLFNTFLFSLNHPESTSLLAPYFIDDLDV